MQELEDSLLAEIFACQEVTNKLHNHIDDEHDYFKKNEEQTPVLQESETNNNFCLMKEEIKTEQGLYTPEFSCMDPKRLTKTNPQNITLSKSAVDLSNKKPITMKENKRLSKLEPKSLKKFRRKMKNRVSIKLRSGLSIKIFSI